MRTLRLMLIATMLIVPWTVTLRGAAMTVAPSIAMADPPAAGDAPAVPNVDVHITEGDRHVVWYANPMLLALGGIGVLLLIIVVAMAARGNGTTIIRER